MHVSGVVDGDARTGRLPSVGAPSLVCFRPSWSGVAGFGGVHTFPCM